jgi:hypothetical protein
VIRRPRPETQHDQHEAADAAATASSSTPSHRSVAILLLLTRFGNALGVTILPFDQHHILGQVAGFGLIIYGLAHWR